MSRPDKLKEVAREWTRDHKTIPDKEEFYSEATMSLLQEIRRGLRIPQINDLCCVVSL